MSQDQPFISWVGPFVGWNKVSGDLQGRANSVSQGDGVSDMTPTCWLWVGRVQKRDSGLCLPFCLGESCPPALALLLDTKVPPRMPLIATLVLELRRSDSE